MVNPLLDELRLSLGGLSEGGKAAMQSAFVLLDGVYQSYQDTEAKVDCALRAQRMGGRVFTFSGKEPPGAALDTKIVAIIIGILR